VKTDTLYQRLEHSLQRSRGEETKNIFLSISQNLEEDARRIQDRLDAGDAGILAGRLIGIKDNIAVKDQPLSCASKMLEGYKSPYSATVVEKIQAADGLIIGKTNLDEFAMGSSGEYSAYGPVPNPLDNERVAGGSSSGSAAAVAAGLVDLALGSDTGGSVRQPAAFCGIVGLKTSYGLISRYGLVSFAPSLDGIGIMSKTVATCAELLGVVAGHDPADATSMEVTIPDYSAALKSDIKGFRIGLPREYYSALTDEDIRSALDNTVQILKEGGAEIIEVSLPYTEYAVPTYYILAMAEASSNLARFDGMRYGRRAAGGELQRVYAQSRSAGFGPEVVRRILMGTFILSEGYYDQYYDKALRVKRRIKEDYERVFKTVDALLCPTTTDKAFKLGERRHDPLQMYAADVFTIPANLAGLPALQIPLGFGYDRLPVGGQLIADAFKEETILRLGHYIERNFSGLGS